MSQNKKAFDELATSGLQLSEQITTYKNTLLRPTAKYKQLSTSKKRYPERENFE